MLWWTLACHTSDAERDRDGDGFTPGQGDCDDRDPDRYPNAPDPAGDGLDADCDGGDGESAALSGLPSAADPDAQPLLQFGCSLATGDVDGDGRDEVLAGSQGIREGALLVGGAWLLRGDGLDPTGPWQGDYVFTGQSVAIAFGGPVPMLLVTDPHAVWAIPADAPPGDTRAAGAWRIAGDDPESFLIANHVDAFDLVGDTADDALVQCGTLDGFDAGMSSVCVVQGPITADTSLGDAHVIVSGARDLGSAIGTADLDGDGHLDLIAGAPEEGVSGGAAYVLPGPLPSGRIDVADAAKTWTAENDGDWLGERAIGGDLDGDGLDDAVVDAMGWPGHERRGRVYLLHLDTPTVQDAPFVLDGDPGYQHLGAALATGDFDADGALDLAVGSPSLPSLDPSLPGRALVFFGPLSGHHQASEADRSYVGEAPGDAAGFALASGDIDGDGFTDLVVDAAYNDEAADDSGKVYLLRGPL